MMMVMMIMIIIAVTQSFSDLGPPDFSWKYIYIILKDNDEDDDNDDDNDDHDDDYSCNSVNFHARTSRFCMEIDLDNI